LLIKENPCLTSAPYQGAPNASKIFEITYEMAKHSIEIGKEEKISDFGVIF